MIENNNNLENLLRQFVEDKQAQQMKGDIQQADGLFDRYAAPSVEPGAIVRIQNRVRHQLTLSHRRHFYRQMIGAAAVIAIFLIGFLTLNSSPDTAVQTSPFKNLTAAEWRLHDTLRSMDQSFEEIEDELGSLTEKIDTLNTSTYEPVSPYQLELIELEDLESMTDSTEFWKG